MKRTEELHELGQSILLDNVTREMLDSGQLQNSGVDVGALAEKLQTDGAKSFVAAWNDLLAHIDQQSAALQGATATEESR